MLNVTIIDTTHQDRPSCELTATEVIVSATSGTLILNPTCIRANVNPADFPTIPLSVGEVIRTCRQGFDLTLSHDWIVKVH